MPRSIRPWLAPITGIYRLFPEDPAGPDAMSGGGAQPEPTPIPPAQPELGDPGKKALDAERAAKRAAEKRAADAEARLKALDDEKLSDQQKAAKRAEEAEARATAAEGRALRLEVVTEAGLPPTLAARLQGSTKEELAADAELLKGLMGTGTNGDGQGGTGSPPQGTNGSRTPKPDPSQGGGKPAEGKSISAGAALFEQRRQQQATPFTT